MNTATHTLSVTVDSFLVWDVIYVVRPAGYYGKGERFEIQSVKDSIFGDEIDDVTSAHLDTIEAAIEADRATFQHDYDRWADDLEAAFAMETDWRATVPADVPGFPWA